MDENTPDRVITYKHAGQELGDEPAALTLHVFNPPGHTADSRRPAIVFFYGGGWNGGTPGQFYPHCAYLASRGMVGISAEYRVNKRHGTSPRECVEDGKSAIRWVRAHATELGVDPERVVAGGGSAGGHVATAAALTDGFDAASDDLAVSCRPGALVLFNPVVDNGPGGFGHDRVAGYWEQFSPMHNIGADAPPTIFFLGDRDKLIPVATAHKYKSLMEEQGRRCDVHIYEGQGHGFFNHRNLAYYVRTVREADRFLASLGYLEGPPTITEASE
jgi:acetyl esterase/lipase